MPILSTVLRVLLAIAFIALCAVTVISTAPFGALAILAFRVGWIGTGLSIVASIAFSGPLIFWTMDRLHVRTGP
ncbi:MAG: hypothetical protein Q7R80_01415 [bacterium]|nr:hypothetical protein [bacterium]